MMGLLNRLFRHEELSGDEACPTYMHRWTLMGFGRYGKVYLHKFVGDDWCIDPHDHPKGFLSIGLKGRYWEDYYLVTPNSAFLLDHGREWRAPWIRYFPPEHIHRISLYRRSLRDYTPVPCWTLCVVGRARRPWGFWLRGEKHWVVWNKFVSKYGKARKAC